MYRKAFPGPALAARIIGPVSMDNLTFEKKVHDLVESRVEDYYIEKHGKPMIINAAGEQEPFQVFAAVSENVSNKKVTGLLDGKRIYELPFIEKGEWDLEKLVKKASEVKGYARLFYELESSSQGKFDVIIRGVNSIDARTASVTNLPFELVTELKQKIREIPEAKNIYIDVTPKPPATIEYV